MAENKLSRTILLGFGDCEEIIKNFETIKSMFEKTLAELESVKDSALDTKNGSWVDTFSWYFFHSIS